MPQICLYFQLHQPYRLNDFNVFDIGHDASYFQMDGPKSNQAIFQKVAQKSYIPMLTLLFQLTRRFPNFVFALSCSGVFLEQAMAFEPKVIQLLQQLARTGQVEFLAETYYHSLASLYSPQEFERQVRRHQQTIQKLFGLWPWVFRNTELVYSNQIGRLVSSLGFKAMLTEAVPRYLHGRAKTQVFTDIDQNLLLLLKHAEFSDDIAFRFSDRKWPEYPLTVEKYLSWLEVYPQEHLINLFMDFETFGEHQWEDTGIFAFFAALVEKFLAKQWNSFVLPSTVLYQHLARLNDKSLTAPIYDVHNPISWADIDRDLTAWIDNDLQKDVISKVYGLEEKILSHQNAQLIADWRRLQTSDHFYYMCTKWSADGDVHAYFSPYDSPYEAYRRYSIVLADIHERLLG